MCLIASPVKTYLKYQKNIIKQLLLMHEHMLGQGGSAQNFFFKSIQMLYLSPAQTREIIQYFFTSPMHCKCEAQCKVYRGQCACHGVAESMHHYVYRILKA